MNVIIFGATGSLGKHVLHQALAAGHQVTVVVRTASKLPVEAGAQVSLRTGDLSVLAPAEIARFISGHDVLVNCAGHVADGQSFANLVDRLVTSVESLPAAAQPVCWFLAGAALLDIDASGRRGVDLPTVKSTYWPHRINLERLGRSELDWRLLCPGPMVERAGARRGPAAHFARPLAGRASRVCSRAAGPPVSAGLRIADSTDDRAVRRRGRAHARQPRSRRRHGAPPRRARPAAGHARPQAAMDGQTK